MQTIVEFRSDRFSVSVGEGRPLADFLREGLRQEGFEAGEPVAEDWGWVVPVANEPFSMWIGCGHNQEYADGFLCFIEPHVPAFRKLLKTVDTRERVGALQQAMDRVLSEAAGIRDKRWWTHDEFSGPALPPRP